jgi:hypothetical protein
MYLQHPEESEYYREYRYYSNRFVENPQIHPALVVFFVVAVFSTLQYVMRRQMYNKAIESIVQGNDFKIKVNEKCIGNKKLKEKVKEELIN